MNIKTSGLYTKITGIQPLTLRNDLKQKYRSSKVLNLFEKGFTLFGIGSITIHNFFLPELLYVLSILPPRGMYGKMSELILKKTWMMNTKKSFSSRINMPLVTKYMNYNLKPYQKSFLDLYDDKKQKYQLSGYILAFEQGLGKTFTSLALMQGLNKDAVIIIAPKSTIRTVWQNEINTIFNVPPRYMGHR